MKYRGASSEPIPNFNIENTQPYNKLPWSSKYKWDHPFEIKQLRNKSYLLFLLLWTQIWTQLRHNSCSCVQILCSNYGWGKENNKGEPFFGPVDFSAWADSSGVWLFLSSPVYWFRFSRAYIKPEPNQNTKGEPRIQPQVGAEARCMS